MGSGALFCKTLLLGVKQDNECKVACCIMAFWMLLIRSNYVKRLIRFNQFLTQLESKWTNKNVEKTEI